MTEKEERWKSLHDDAIDYRQTVEALLTFAAFVVHDGESKRANADFGFGRRMTNNDDADTSNVTPDLVAQKSLSYGVVAEAKKSLTRDQSQWPKHLEQLRKYDTDLQGWWTDNELIHHSNTVMLVHHSRSRAFIRFIEGEKVNDASKIGPRTSVVEFSESPESGINIFFRLEYGTIEDAELATKLENGVPVPLHEVIKSFAHIRYYDSRPPMCQLLKELWTDYFPSLLPEADYDEELNARRIRVTIDTTAAELQKANGSLALTVDHRSSEFPRKSWIREAFDRLVKYNLALPPQEGSDEYTILYKGFRDDVLEHFAKLEVGISDKKIAKTEEQMGLFENNN